MAPRKDGSDQNLEEKNLAFSPDQERVNDEDNLDTRDISHNIEEGDEDDDEESGNEELTEADFDIDEGEEENEPE